jgi:hypothetical protein
MCIILLPASAFAADGDAPEEQLAIGKPITGTYLDDVSDGMNLNPASNPNTWNMLNDGIYGNIDNWGDATTWLKMLRNVGREIVIDLQEVDTVNSIGIGMGRNNSVGIRIPQYVKYYVSNDAINYTYLGKAYPDTPIYVETLTKSSGIDRKLYKMDKVTDKLAGAIPMNIQARYVKVMIPVDVNLWADEIEVKGHKGIVNNAIIPQPVPDDSPVVNKFPAKNSVESAGLSDQFLFYTGPFATPETTNWTQDKVSKILGYVDKNGNIKDWFFDQILVTPVGSTLNPSGKGIFETKTDYETFMNFIFQQDTQLGAINKVAGELNKKFGTNKKVKIDISVYFPNAKIDTHDFGDIRGDGSVISFDPNDFASKVSDPTSVEGKAEMFQMAFNNKLEALKWYVDEVEKRFKAAGYENLDFDSYYLSVENMNSLKNEDVLTSKVAEYVKSKGYYCTWIPYVGTMSPLIWKEMGVSSATQQPNYAFGGRQRTIVPESVNISKKYGMGVEIELGYTKPMVVTMARFMEYLNLGALMGYMKDTYHNYYLNTTTLVDNAISTDPMLRASYDKIYDFVKEKYKPSYLMEALDVNANITDKSNIIVPVSILNASNFVEGSFSILYDSSKLDFKDSKIGAQLNGKGTYTVDTTIPGLIKVNYKISDNVNALYGDEGNPKDITKGRAQIVNLYFSKKQGVDDSQITKTLFVTNQPGTMKDKDGNVYTNWSEGFAIPDNMRSTVIGYVSGETAKVEDALKETELKLQNSDLSIENVNDRNALLNELRVQLNDVESKCKVVEDMVPVLPGIADSEMPQDIANIKERISAIYGVIGSIRSILTESEDNFRKSNGNAEIRINIKKQSEVNLSDLLSSEISSKFGAANDLRWVSVDKSRALVDQSGNMIVLKNGVTKICIYNQNYVLDVYLVLSGK